ncbi:plasmid maintenance system killer protein [Leptospira inadai serovar Lyme str. 10]|uniref:Plasmid maintenance system killer protein n=2 Tax=Leptospira inadai serovar Lyme TaxID=293084 RepID=V6HQ36_9LEPT|nr:type II toxin-antitoxin system RelE/ParE family toxin [Leptospira inadai]EQA38915.1 plasmid maintenance system killer protein [Leptospira inadai serovar Lyme str. 10]PNV72119.1 plasmid maintenance system killer [Leptospira inadai serovar Lyme]
MITSFGDRDTERVFSGEYTKRIPSEIRKRAQRKLDQLNSAEQLSDLLIPPSNRLHQLKGDKKDQWSISIDKQFRICFTWNKGNAENVIIEDYH